MFEFLWYVFLGCVIVGLLFSGPWLVALGIAILFGITTLFNKLEGK